MKTLDTLKSIGRKALVGGLVLGSLAGCGVREERVQVTGKIDENYTAKYIKIDRRNMGDDYKFVIEDSTGNRIVELVDIITPISLRVKLIDGSEMVGQRDKGVYLKEIYIERENENN